MMCTDYVYPMREAIKAAQMYQGATSPNPPVGAVGLDKDGRIIAIAAHQRAGEAHAEAALLQQLEAKRETHQLHTLVVTLEPCNHTGRTAPCCDAILASPAKTIVIGMVDPNPGVAGGGIERLRRNGRHVIVGVEEKTCQTMLHAFVTRQTTNLPWITIKRAFNAEGDMRPPAGAKTFTEKKSLLLAHLLRKKSDAIVCGSGTIVADNPLFTVRHVQDHVEKYRYLYVLDRRERVPAAYFDAARERHFIPLRVRHSADLPDLWRQHGVQDVLVEAGPTLSQSLIDANLWHMIVDIHHDGSHPDRLNVRLNEYHSIRFTRDDFEWRSFLPSTELDFDHDCT